jgi:hypothetical protein
MFNSNMYNMYGSDQFPAGCGGQCHTLIMYSVSVTRPAVKVRLSHDAGLVNSGGDNQETKKKEEHKREKRTQKKGKKQEQDLLRNKCSLKSSPLMNTKPLK